MASKWLSAASAPATDAVLEVDGSPDASWSESSGVGGSRGSGRVVQYSGWVYHLGVNRIGHAYCHLRFLVLRGNRVAMFRRDPNESVGIKPIRTGVISHSLMVGGVGRRKANNGDIYVITLYNRLDETKKGEIACPTPGEAHKWIEAFEQAKQQADYDIMKGSGWNQLNNTENELNLEGHRPRVRRGLEKLIRIGKGPELLLRQTSDLGGYGTKTDGEMGDVDEAHEWRCVHVANGIRVFEDISNSKGRTVVLKSVSVVDANVDKVFEVIMCLDKHTRYEWDMVTADLESLGSIDDHYDVIYGQYNPKYFSWWKAKKDFIFSRQWFRGQDGAYTILQSSAFHRKKPPVRGYQRTKLNPSIWEIRRLDSSGSTNPKCLLTHMLEIRTSFWNRHRTRWLNFQRSLPFALLCQVSGIKEYFGANPALKFDLPSTVVVSKPSSDPSAVHVGHSEELENNDVFYDADGGEDVEDEDSDGDEVVDNATVSKLKLKNVSWAIASLAIKRKRALVETSQLDTSIPPVTIDATQFHGSLPPERIQGSSNCWSSPGGQKFMIRGKTYLEDHTKIAGGDPLLRLIAVDWLKSDERMDSVALNPKCAVQSEAGKKIPFVLVINLQIPANPNYSLVLYYGADRPVNKDSLIGRFVDGSDVFRDSRFKLIPSILEGYWMVKRAVGTKACLLGKAVTCNYLRRDNFLEIDVDIGSSSVARSIISLVLGYVTGLVVDLAILIEAKEEVELPEYILGTVRLVHVKPDSAVSL